MGKTNSDNRSPLFTILTVISVSALMISNIIATKQFQVGFLTLPAAMLVFPITYIISDVMSEVYGYKASRFSAWLGFTLNAFMVLVFTISIMLPYPDYFTNQSAFELVLGSTPRIFIASTISYTLGDWANDLTFRFMKRRNNHSAKGFKARAIASSMVGEAVDASIFIPVAFIGSMPTGEIVKMIAVQWITKIAYEVLILPVTSQVVKMTRKAEPNIKEFA